jgi:hypothetical protein
MTFEISSSISYIPKHSNPPTHNRSSHSHNLKQLTCVGTNFHLPFPSTTPVHASNWSTRSSSPLLHAVASCALSSVSTHHHTPLDLPRHHHIHVRSAKTKNRVGIKVNVLPQPTPTIKNIYPRHKTRISDYCTPAVVKVYIL